jgi:D-alanine-D-alanine ligase
MIHVDPDWWKSLFDDIYLVTDAPFVCNSALTKREVDVVQQVLHLCPSDRILDLCGGQGRHALELARHGYQHLMVLDYAPFLLQHGRQETADVGLDVGFCRGDARSLPLHSACLDVVLLMANSFGYFIDVADDQRLLAEVMRVLRRGGRFLLDLTDYDYTVCHFLPESWHEATEDVVVCWKRERTGDVIRVREMVLSKSKGLLRDRTYAERLYRPEHLCALLEAVGFSHPRVHHNAFIYDPDDGRDYGMATHRMLITVTKG